MNLLKCSIFLISVMLSSAHSYAEFLSSNQPPYKISASQFEHAKKSVFRFYSKGDMCTGTHLTNDGIFLTALHCFDKCLKDLKHVTVVDTLSEHSLYEVDQDRVTRGNAFCTIRIDGHDFQTAHLIVTGRGYSDKGYENALLDKNNLNLDAIRRLRKVGFGTADDFAIVKVKLDNQQACQNISYSANLKAGEQLWTLGYPAKADRQNARSSDGESMQMSVGVVNQTVLENPCVTYTTDESAKAIQQYLDIPGTMWTTLDSAGGASGSPTWNKFGQINGMIISTNTKKGSENEYCPGGVRVLDVSSMFNYLGQTINQEQLKKMTMCQ